MNHTLAILGAGRLGSALARKTPADWDKILVTRTRARADALARKCARARSGDFPDLVRAEVVFLAVPADELETVLRRAVPHMAPEALLVNCATSVLTPEVRGITGDVPIVAAKVLGNVAGLDEAHLVVVDGANHRQFELLHHLLGGLGQVVMGSEEQVRVASTLAVEAALSAALAIERGMAEHKLPAAWRKVLLSALAAGTLRAYADGELGALSRSILGRLKRE